MFSDVVFPFFVAEFEAICFSLPVCVPFPLVKGIELDVTVFDGAFPVLDDVFFRVSILLSKPLILSSSFEISLSLVGSVRCV